MVGKHAILELKMKPGSTWLTSPDDVEALFHRIAKLCRCIVIFSNFRSFPVTDGFTGVVGLAESHMSIHTWPEHDYIAIDVFMCGDKDPEMAADLIATRMIDDVVHKTMRVLDRGPDAV